MSTASRFSPSAVRQTTLPEIKSAGYVVELYDYSSMVDILKLTTPATDSPWDDLWVPNRGSVRPMELGWTAPGVGELVGAEFLDMTAASRSRLTRMIQSQKPKNDTLKCRGNPRAWLTAGGEKLPRAIQPVRDDVLILQAHPFRAAVNALVDDGRRIEEARHGRQVCWMPNAAFTCGAPLSSHRRRQPHPRGAVQAHTGMRVAPSGATARHGAAWGQMRVPRRISAGASRVLWWNAAS